MTLETRYATIADYMRTQNYPEDVIQLLFENERPVDEKLERKECPTCSGSLTRTKDDRQSGCLGPFPKGEWFNYRCACGYFVDRVE